EEEIRKYILYHDLEKERYIFRGYYDSCVESSGRRRRNYTASSGMAKLMMTTHGKCVKYSLSVS
ncbi:hypothetical protein, partial [Klebsiella pneumoniae]|uniref:hypothetical protein n=1 Tax=Klebsiella pneumoniae TaxID=573 RepID=UPI00405565DC